MKVIIEWNIRNKITASLNEILKIGSAILE